MKKWFVASLGLMGALTALASAQTPQPLPSIDCVKQVREARIQIQLGHTEEGIAQLRRAVEAHPTELLPATELWRASRDLKLPAEQQSAVRETLLGRVADPDRPLPEGVLQRLTEADGSDSATIERTLDALVARSGKRARDIALLESILDLQIRLQRLDPARKTLDRIMALDARPSHRRKAVALDLHFQRWASAEKLLRDLMADGDDVVPMLAAVLNRLGRFDDLEALLADTTQDDTAPYAAALLFDAAWQARDRGDHERAERYLRQVTKSAPNNEEPKRALVYLYGTDAEIAALDAAQTSRRAGLSDPDQLIREGASLMASRDYARAVPLLERAVELAPESELGLLNLGIAYVQLRDWGPAVTRLRQAAAINPERFDTLANLGIALAGAGRHEEAVATLSRLLELNPEYTQAHYYLGKSYQALGQSVKAQEHFERYQAR